MAQPKIFLRIFYGGEHGQSRSHFESAIGKLRGTYSSDKLEICSYTTDQLKENPDAPKSEVELIDWLIGSDLPEAVRATSKVIHAIVGHLCQVSDQL